MLDNNRSPFIAESSIAVPFTVTKAGKVASSTSQEKVWEYRVKGALGTALGERLHAPNYGVDFSGIEFNTESIAVEIIEREIDALFSNYLGDLALESVTSSLDHSTGVLDVTVSYFLPNNSLASVTMGVAAISGDSPISEVL